MEKPTWVKLYFSEAISEVSNVDVYIAKETDRMFFISKEVIRSMEERENEWGMVVKVVPVFKFYNKDFVFCVEIIDDPTEGFFEGYDNF